MTERLVTALQEQQQQQRHPLARRDVCVHPYFSSRFHLNARSFLEPPNPPNMVEIA
eukprot:CAMPEP_0184753990 /NCGR_PEP_ID=MMETSP0315-20130426/44389_1 /TAXON_ID=101924 /ORGANISM="Rhodosorus marinus, Strain UTEX LB 2760" /LENGTH=55 /DNA_ID=CAMNT_0027233389 /DNA_START=2107 /DNA_END=2271 /DNA_ORIENTATION=+